MAIEFVDSHTGGEPTRVIVAGGPELAGKTVAEKADYFARELDWFRAAAVNEPRGNDVLVGAILVEPSDARAACGVIFFNNVGVLGMCGHGTIGVAVTLAHLKRLSVGQHLLETPVGLVGVTLEDAHTASIENVPSWRTQKQTAITMPDGQVVRGDVAWGGNWFFLCSDHGRTLSVGKVDELTHYAWEMRQELARQRITGSDGREIDHIELFGPPSSPHKADSRSFVLCPGKAYDRSPCGTGTSAKVACLAADGKLPVDKTWRQESIIGSVFEATYREGPQPGQVIPTIRGQAYVTAVGQLHLDPDDPFVHGIRTGK
jgi:4-hydroxyproline epimerase